MNERTLTPYTQTGEVFRLSRGDFANCRILMLSGKAMMSCAHVQVAENLSVSTDGSQLPGKSLTAADTSMLSLPIVCPRPLR